MKKNYTDFFNKLKEIFKGKDDYYLETYEDTDKKIKGKLYGHIGKWFIIVPLLLLVGVILYKAIPAIINLQMNKANVTNEEKKIKNTQMTFSNDEMWKMQSEEKQKKLETNVVEVKTDVKEIKETLKTSIETISTNIDKSIKTNQEVTENLKSELTNKIENTKQDIENVKSESLVNIEKLKNSNELQVNDSNTKLDPNKLVQFNPQKPNNVNTNNEIPKININSNKNDFEYVEIGQSSSININTLEKKEEDKEPKEFYLSGGFAVATLLTGGNFNTLSDGEKDTIPVTLSIDSKLKTPNNEEMDLRECFVRGAGKADFTSQTAVVTLTNLQCNLVDSKGNHYKINKKINGWLWDENGEYGAKGRLITKEGEIISKALPLAFMQTAMEIMTNKSKQTTTNRDGVIDVTGTSAAFGANASSTIIDKIGDKWLKYMDGLNPKVNLRPGRQLVVQFEGGESLKIEKDTPADIENFKKTFDEGENYEE